MRIDALHHLAVELEYEAQHTVRRRMLRPEIDLEIAERASFSHHAAPANAFARLSATRLLNLSHFTTKRSCSPPPIFSTPSYPETSKRTFGPSTAIIFAFTVIVIPGGVAASCEKSTCVPRLPSPSSRCSASNSRHTHSNRPTMKPVANTSGMATKLFASG